MLAFAFFETRDGSTRQSAFGMVMKTAAQSSRRRSERVMVAYAFATGGAIAPAAGAAVVYSGLQNLTVAWTGSATSVNFDVNGGGADFSFGWDSSNDAVIDGIGPTNAVLLSVSNTLLAQRVSAGTTLTGAGTWDDGEKDLASYSAGGAWEGGDWTAGSTGYAALKMTVGPSTYLGWARFTVPTSAGAGQQITLVDWAYESTAGQSILVPAPGALVSLALGAAGLRGRRSRTS